MGICSICLNKELAIIKTQIVHELDKLKDALTALSDDIGIHPELSLEEYHAAALLSDFLSKHGFTVENNICDYPTAFKAVCDSGRPGPNIAFLAEYDALPEIGHGCGHNLIAAMSTGAGLALSTVLTQTGGKVTLLGTPAEETSGAKVIMADKGVFADIDAALIVHPHATTHASGSSLALEALQFEFFGRTSHAASAPEKGINALDAVLQFFNAVNALRQQVSPDVRIHGIITKGGIAPNMIPDHTAAKFYVRAGSRKSLKELVTKVKSCAQGAALATGTKVSISNYEYSYDSMQTNQTLSDSFNANLLSLGEPSILPPLSNLGSIDMGNVSYVVPAIHPYIGIGNETLVGHTAELAAATLLAPAHQALLRGAKAMALTGYEILTDTNLLAKMKTEFNEMLAEKR